MKKHVSLALAIGLISFAGVAQSEEGAVTSSTTATEQAPQSLEQRLSILERKFELEQEAAATKAATGSGAQTKDGFALKTNDGNTQLRISGLIQADYRDYLADANLADQFLLRRVRPTVAGTIDKVLDFRLTAEFASSFQLLDAYGEVKTYPWFKVRAGKFTPPIGLERLQSASAISFVEGGYPTAFVPNRDTGLQIAGDSANGVVSYQIGIFNGVVDGGTGESDNTDGKDYVARIFAHPFKSVSSDWINGLGIGLAASIGDQIGTPGTAASNTNSQLPSFRSTSQQTFFSYRAGAYADGDRSRIVPQAYWYVGAVGFLAEYAVTSQDVSVFTSTTSATINNRAWQVAATWVVTGERASFRGVKPRKAFDPKTGAWGALELTGRLTELTVDDEAFVGNIFANIATSAKRARSYSGGFNWYLSNNTKVVSNYEYTKFVGGAAGGQDRAPERAIFSRIQFSY